MNSFFEALKNSTILEPLFKAAGNAMASRFRHWIHDPVEIVQGAEIRPGDTVLEVGCGSGFFTTAAARLVGDSGRLVAMDVLPTYIERVSQDARAANLKNVRTIQADALETGLDDASMDAALLFGVIPFPTLPLDRLLPEMYRVLKPGGILAVWLFPFDLGVPQSILRSGLFEHVSNRNDVYNYRRCQRSG